jgi:hypothetical protein
MELGSSVLRSQKPASRFCVTLGGGGGLLWGVVSTLPNLHVGESPIIGSLQLFIQHRPIRS